MVSSTLFYYGWCTFCGLIRNGQALNAVLKTLQEITFWTSS